MEGNLEPVKEILLPIDIHYNKLLDWLINRRHCKQEWQASILDVREKISAAITDMPAVPEITSLIKGSHINYFHCRRIMELLKDTEAESKDMFGRYSSQRMKDWQEVMKLYEKDDLYLGEAAQLLARNVNYEVPILKKQIVKCQQTQKDCAKKETDYGSTSAEYREKYTTMCKQMGIEGKNIKSEMAALVADLPNVYTSLAEDSKGLKPATEYYTAFVNFTAQNDIKTSEILPTLRHIHTHGNTTTYEYERGEAPKEVEETTVQIDVVGEGGESGDGVENGVEIDWGDIEYDPADTSIDIDYDLGDITIEDGGIEMECSGDAHDISASIDFDDDEITVKGSAHTEKEHAKDTAVDDGVARGRMAKTVLDNTETRNTFLDDLMELEAFLSQRQTESHNNEDILSTCQLSSAPDCCHVDEKTLAAMLDSVQKLLSRLTSVRMQHLVLIRNAPRYVDRIEENLKQTLSVSDKMTFYQKQSVERRLEAGKDIDKRRPQVDTLVKQTRVLQSQSVERRLEAGKDIDKLRPQVDTLVKQTRVLQSQIEEEISKRYKSRPVNIMGEINTM